MKLKIILIATLIVILIAILIVTTPAFCQTMYKCQDGSGVVTFRQTPCAGNGEAVPVKAIPTTGTTLEVNEQGHQYMAGNAERWKAQAEAEKQRDFRNEDMSLEMRKARAAEEQAEAQRATARAIRATGRRF